MADSEVIQLGKVQMQLKGEYNATITYTKLDIVSYNGSSYVCKKDALNIDPTNESYWQIIALKGKTGDVGYTPIKGEDYFSEEEIKEIQNNILNSETIRNYKEKIENLQKENVEQQEKLKALYGDFKENIIGGETVIVSDGLTSSKIEVNGDGNLYQDTREGYNLLIEEFENGGSADANTARLRIKQELKLKKDTTYTLVTNLDMSVYGIAVGLALTPFPIADISGLVYDSGWLTTTKHSFSTNTASIIADEYYCNVVIKKLDETDIKVEDVAEYEIMLYEGTEDKLYEKFGEMPSKNYPSNVEVINGVNILNFNIEQDSRVTINDDGTLTLNGTGGFNLMFEEITLVTGKQYSQKIELVSGSITGVDINNAFRNFANNDWLNINNNTIYSPIEDEIKTSIWINNSAIFENAKIKIWCNEGDTIKPYLPYGHIGLLQRGKNLWKNLIKEGTVIEHNGITYTIKNKGIINIKGTSTDMSEIWLLGNNWTSKTKLINLKENQKYTASCNITTSGVQIIPLKLASTVIAYLNSTSNNNIFTADSNGISKILLRVNSGVTVDEDIEFQIEDGEVATEIEEYIEPKIIPIDLDKNFIAKIDEDMKDLLNIGVDGSVEIDNKNIGKYIFTGNENFIKSSSTTNTIFQYTGLNTLVKRPSSSSTLMLSYSNYFRGDYTANDIFSSNVKGIAINGSGNFNIGLGLDSDITTITELQNWLKEKYENGNPMYFLYPLATPADITLPLIESIELFEGTNVFEFITNLNTTLNVTYKVSNKSRLEELEQALLSLGVNI